MFFIAICQVQGGIDPDPFATDCQQLIIQIKQKLSWLAKNSFNIRRVKLKKRSLPVSSFQTSPVPFAPGLAIVNPYFADRLVAGWTKHWYRQAIYLIGCQYVASVSYTLFLVLLVGFEPGCGELQHPGKKIKAGEIL